MRSHPHIVLSTVGYLYQGAFHHRDGPVSDQAITAGAVILVTDGSGVTYSEWTRV